MPKSLLEPLPEIAVRGRQEAEKNLEGLEGRHRVGLQTKEPASHSLIPHSLHRGYGRVAFVGILALLAIVLAVGATILRAYPTPPAGKIETSSSSFGFLDQPVEQVLTGSTVVLSGWALDTFGVAKVEAVLDDNIHLPLNYGIARPDVQGAYRQLPHNGNAGFDGKLDLKPYLTDLHELRVDAINQRGERHQIGKRTLVSPFAKNTWGLEQQHSSPDQNFYILMATSGLAKGGAAEIETLYAPFVSSTIKVGIRIPILYLRTTKGKGQDWVFDPNFDTKRPCGDKTLADDSLQQVIDYAIRHKLPTLFTLNGGIWADAQCDNPEWDVNDALEQNIDNCQWNERNEVFTDDYLKTLPGSMNSPELARVLSLNIYNEKMRYYKKRNLQQAAQVIRQFAQQHPDLFVGINLDPDVYINPFFTQPKHWHDYNPNTIRQFREWLSGTGVYAEQTSKDGTNLSSYRREKPLDLKQIGELMGRPIHSWQEVDPPRELLDISRFAWLKIKWNLFRHHLKVRDFKTDPWFREWELFRRHLVKVHYDDLSTWLTEAGISSNKIFSSQGLIGNKEGAPFPIKLNGPVKMYDSAGISIEGAVPKAGHLGAILYGDSSLNNVDLEEKPSLFATFRSLDANWAAVEHNTGDFRTPTTLPGFAAGYHSIRDLFNYGARFVSPMAWNGANGLGEGKAGFTGYTSLRNTPLEDAFREFMISHANLPRGSRMWTFGSRRYADNDGWSATTGRFDQGNGEITLFPNPSHEVTLLSPNELAYRFKTGDSIALGGIDRALLETVTVDGLDAQTGSWFSLQGTHGLADATTTPGGLTLFVESLAASTTEQIRIGLKFQPNATTQKIRHIAIYPKHF